MDQDIFLDDGMDRVKFGAEDQSREALTDRTTVGQKLFEARRDSRETDLEKISVELCIRPHLLEALERNDFDKFPSACYAAGFLKNYASYLGLNVDQVVAQYKNEFHGSSKKVNLVFLGVEKNHNRARQMVVSLAILSVLVLFGVWYSTNGGDRISLSALPDVSEVTSNILLSAAKEEQKTQVIAEVKPRTLPNEALQKDRGFHLVQPVNATPLAQTVNTVSPETEQLRLSVREDAWIRIIGADRQILVDRILLAGEEFYVTDRGSMTLMTSNAGAVSVLVDDIAIALLGDPGEIRDNISLDRKDLLMKTTQLFP